MDDKKSAVPGSQPDTTQEYVIELSESEIAAIEAEAAENMKNWVEPDKHFFIIPDDDTQTLIVCPTERKYQAIKLNKTTAELMITLIRRCIQNWQ